MIVITVAVTARIAGVGRLEVHEMASALPIGRSDLVLQVLDILADAVQLLKDARVGVVVCKICRLRSGASVQGCHIRLEVCCSLIRCRFEMPEYLQLFHDSFVKILLINLFSNVVIVSRYDIVSRVRMQ